MVKPKTYIQSVDRALDILEVIIQSPVALSIHAIAQRLGLHQNTVGNLVRTLYYRGYVSQELAGRYTVGPQCLHLSEHHGSLGILRQSAEPIAEKLARQTGDNVFLGIDQNDELYCVLEVRGSGAVVVSGRQVWLNQMHSTAAGQVLLAWGAEPLERRLAGLSLSVITPATITSVPALKEKLLASRDDGFVLCREESCAGVSSLAVPVWGPKGRLLAALGQAFPTYALETGQIHPRQRSEQLAESAREITLNFQLPQPERREHVLEASP